MGICIILHLINRVFSPKSIGPNFESLLVANKQAFWTFRGKYCVVKIFTGRIWRKWTLAQKLLVLEWCNLAKS